MSLGSNPQPPSRPSPWARAREAWRAARKALDARWHGGREAVARGRRRLAGAWTGWSAAHPVALRRTRLGLHVAALLALAAATYAYGRHVLDTYGQATVDDAGITYAYADNLASGNGLRLTPSEAPTEGYSNPLQVLLLAPVARFTNDVDPASKALNVGLAALALGLLCAFAYVHLRGVGRLFAGVPLALAVYWAGFNYWVAAGLEGGILTSLQIVSLLGAYYGPRHKGADVALGVAAGLLAWTRPEGIVYGAIAVLVRLFREPAGRRWLAAAIFGGLVAALFGFRWLAFRDVVPNTYYAKVPGRSFWWSLTTEESPGRRYVTTFFREMWWYFAVPLWAAAPVWREAQALTVAALGQLVFAIFFPLYVGGDWMVEWRFMQPMFGPLVVLSTVGLVGVLGSEERLGRNAARALLAAVVFGLAALVAFNPPGWKTRRNQIASHRDIDLRTVQARAPGYHKLAAALHLGRPPLVAEVDIGGLAYRSGLEILDVAGLSDRALGLARARQSAIAPDYIYGERLPDFLHLHASWVQSTPYHRFSAFRSFYRELAPAQLQQLGVTPMTAVRADLLDPLAPPARRVDLALPNVRLTGLTAMTAGRTIVLALHARQRSGHTPLGPTWVDGAGRRYLARWHAGLGLLGAAMPGANVVAVLALPVDVPLPLTLDGTPIRVDDWPLAAAGDRSAADLARVPLLRVAGQARPPCDPEHLLDPRADPVRRARGAGFVARVCGGLPELVAGQWQERAMDAAEDAERPEDRYEAAAATLFLGVPQRLSTRLLLEETRPRRLPFDEVLDAWAREDFAAAVDDPQRAEVGLRMLLTGRRWSDVLLQGLAFGVDVPGVAGPVCTAARMLGLRPDAVAPGLDCSRVPDTPPVRVVRQSFENPDDPLLRYVDDGTGTMRPTAMRRVQCDQHEIGGGHGRLLVNSYGERDRDRTVGAVIWGPLPWAGRRFGVLVGGGKNSDKLHVAVEGLVDGRWVTLARLASPGDEEVLHARIADLGERPAQQIRVQVIDASREGWGHIIADGITLIDEPVGR